MFGELAIDLIGCRMGKANDSYSKEQLCGKFEREQRLGDIEALIQEEEEEEDGCNRLWQVSITSIS